MTDIYDSLDNPTPQQPATAPDIYAPLDLSQPPPAAAPEGGGLVHNYVEPFLRNAASSATFGLWDRARALPDVAAGTPYNQAVDNQVARLQQGRQSMGPLLSSTSDIAGGMATGAGLAKSGISFLGREVAAPLLRRVGLGALESALYGAAEGAGHTYTGKLPDYIQNATVGGALSGAVGAALPAFGAAASAGYKALSDRWSGIPAPVLKAGAADAPGLAKLSQLGPDAMLADAGPSMQATAQAAVQGMGENRSSIVNALMARDQGTVPRLDADRIAALGPRPPSRGQVESTIDAERKQINANEYAPVLQGRAMSPQGADQVMAKLDTLGQSSRVDMGDVKNALILPGTQNLPDLAPQTWLQARHNVDAMISVANRTGDNYRVGVLKQARDMIDNELQAAVPGIKTADAKWAVNHAQGEAFDAGHDLLDAGKNAMHPEDLKRLMQVSPPAVNARLQQGLHSDLERRFGTPGNDLSQLEKIVGTPGDWNHQNISTVFGPDAAQALADSAARNRQYRETYQRVAQGSPTGERIAAREDTGMKPVDLSRVTLTGTVLEGAKRSWEAIRGAAQEEQRNSIARLMALRDPNQVAQAANDILAQNARTARGGPVADKYARALLQGGAAGGFTPLYTD